MNKLFFTLLFIVSLFFSFNVTAYDPYEEYRNVDCLKLYYSITLLEMSLKYVEKDSEDYSRIKNRLIKLESLQEWICIEA